MKAKSWIIIVVIILIVGYFIYRNTTADPLDYVMSNEANVVYHIHPELEIDFLGEKQVIPPQIGISARGLHVIHTHDASGEIHVESPYFHQFYLRDFFKIWGKQFNSTCIFDACVDATHTLEFFIDGKPDTRFENLPLIDGEQIKIVFRKR